MQCDSSMTFWLRRCMLQSRTPGAQTVPWWSAISWTSTWRAPVTTRSRNTVGSPNALAPSDLALSNAAASCAGIVDAADAAAASARGGLDHQRVADPLGVIGGILDRVDGTAAPRRDRYVGLLGQQLGGDLVAELAHHVRARADEDDAEPFAQFGELGTFGDEPPADPGGVGTRALRSARSRVARSRYGLPGASAPVPASRHTASSASRTNIAACSALVCKATVESSAPVARRSSRTAWIRRIAGSPRLTMAMRRRTPRSPTFIVRESTQAGAAAGIDRQLAPWIAASRWVVGESTTVKTGVRAGFPGSSRRP